VQEKYPAEKKKVTKAVDQLRAKMIALEKTVKTIESPKDSATIKFDDLSLKVDAVINTEANCSSEEKESKFERSCQLQKVARVQKNRHETQEKYFSSSLSRIKIGEEVAKQVLRRANKLEVLAAKNDITQKFTDVNATTEMLPPRDMISCDLIVDSTLDQSFLQNLEKIAISQGDDEAEYSLAMYNLTNDDEVEQTLNLYHWKIGGRFRTQ